MTQKEKDLLLKDLCARLPYNVAINCNNEDANYTCYLTFDILSEIMHDKCYYIYKPYLFPLSSMTEKQKKEQEAHFTCIKHDMSFSICRYMEWCYKNHLDINDLIPKGLAIDATELNIY